MYHDVDPSTICNFLSIEGDSSRYLQILLNFLSNAIKFTPNGGQIKIEVKLIES